MLALEIWALKAKFSVSLPRSPERVMLISSLKKAKMYKYNACSTSNVMGPRVLPDKFFLTLGNLFN